MKSKFKPTMSFSIVRKHVKKVKGLCPGVSKIFN